MVSILSLLDADLDHLVAQLPPIEHADEPEHALFESMLVEHYVGHLTDGALLVLDTRGADREGPENTLVIVARGNRRLDVEPARHMGESAVLIAGDGALKAAGDHATLEIAAVNAEKGCVRLACEQLLLIEGVVATLDEVPPYVDDLGPGGAAGRPRLTSELEPLRATWLWRRPVEHAAPLQ